MDKLRGNCIHTDEAASGELSCFSGSSAEHRPALMTLKAVSKGFDIVSGAGGTKDRKESRLEILHNIDFTIYQGETIAIVGNSGIGKSTLLHIIGTLDKPDHGKVFFMGKDLFSMEDEKLARFRNTKIGFVFQFHHLLQGFTALENVMIPCMLNGNKKKEAKSSALSVLSKVGLRSRAFYRIEELSGGEQQRVALARALVVKPDMLLADEPTGNLDKKNTDEVHRLLMDLNREFDMTMVIVTHNAGLADLMEKKVTIDDGKIVTF